MADLKPKHRRTKEVKGDFKKTNEVPINFGNVEKIKLLLLESINKNILENNKLLKEVKDILNKV